MKKNILSAGLIVLCCACASHKYSPPTISEASTSEELITLEHMEPPMELAVVEQLPPPPDADQNTFLEEQKNKALADTTVYEGVTLQDYPYFHYNNQNLHFYLEEKINKAKTEFNITQRGVLKIRIVVERDGSITNPVIEESNSDVLTKHSLAILKQMPKWHPGSINGWNRRSYTTVRFNW